MSTADIGLVSYEVFQRGRLLDRNDERLCGR
jgi:hypothetical protein